MNRSLAPLALVIGLAAGCGSAPPPGLYPPAASATSDTPPPVASEAPPAPGGAAPLAWAPYTSAECGYTLPMPGTPKTSSDSVDTPSGKQTIYSATSDLGDRAAIVSCSDIPPYPSSDATLDGARDGAVAHTHGTLVASRNVTVDGFPGRDAVIQVQDKKLNVRLVLAKQRLYTLVVLGFAADETQHCIDGFSVAAKH
jgi:hypothetical protein